MRKNEINRTSMAVRERERESKRIEKTCSAFDVENIVRNINKGMDYGKKRCKKDKSFFESNLSFLCANEKGITLLALILTVVIMIILAAVTINIALGEGGLVDQAKWAAEQTANSTKTEQEQLAELEQEFANLMAEDSEIPLPEPEEPSIPESTSYVGYYADVDGNGTVDGVIYVDLATDGGKSGQWGDGYGKYTIPTGSNFKKYKVNKSGHSDDFGTKDVLTVANSSGNERFYVMALDDVDSKEYCWYYSAWGNMNDYSTTTSTSFGSGKQNTKNMIEKWNSNEYGSKNGNSEYPDVWSLSTVQSKINANPAWYVPSSGECGAFADKLGITPSNYASKGLSNCYWSSSQYGINGAWYANLDYGCMYGQDVRSYFYVRLGTNF